MAQKVGVGGAGGGLRSLRGSHSFQRERRGNQSSPTEDKAEYKGGIKWTANCKYGEIIRMLQSLMEKIKSINPPSPLR